MKYFRKAITVLMFLSFTFLVSAIIIRWTGLITSLPEFIQSLFNNHLIEIISVVTLSVTVLIEKVILEFKSEEEAKEIEEVEENEVVK